MVEPFPEAGTVEHGQSEAEDSVIADLLNTGAAFARDYEHYRAALDEIAPVWKRVQVVDIPSGFAPFDIREDWVGVTLPLRLPPREDGKFKVFAREAIETLKNSAPNAYDWWCQHFIEEAERDPRLVDEDGQPDMVTNTTVLYFDLSFTKIDEDNER